MVMQIRTALKRILNKYFDYEIVGHYYDHDGEHNYKKKYNRKYYLRRRKKRWGSGSRRCTLNGG